MTTEDNGTSEKSDVGKLFNFVHVSVDRQHTLPRQLVRQQLLQRRRSVTHIRTKVDKQENVSIHVVA